MYFQGLRYNITFIPAHVCTEKKGTLNISHSLFLPTKGKKKKRKENLPRAFAMPVFTLDC